MAVQHRRPSFFVVAVLLLLFGLLLGAAEGSTAATQSSSQKQHHQQHGRQAQGNFQQPPGPGVNGGGWVWSGCDPSQCYREDYNLCFHSSSWECKNKPDPVETIVVTPPPSPRPVTRYIETENPILLRLLNVPENYKLSSMDRAQIRSKIRALLDDELDDTWEIIRVESPLGQYTGDRRRLQSSLLRGGNTRRRLNRTLYIPIIVTLRGREDMADMSLVFVLQALRNKLNILLTYIKSLNSSAFSSLQLTFDELNLSDVVNVVEVGGGETTVNIQTTTDTGTNNANTEAKASVEVEAPPPQPTGTPGWVWGVVAAVLIIAALCLLMCMCKAGWFLCCTDCSCFRKKRDSKEDYELQKQLAIERWRQQPVVQNRRDGDALGGLVAVGRHRESCGGRYENRDEYERRRQHDVRRTRSDGVRRHHGGARRRGDHGRRGHGDRRRGGHGRRRHGDKRRGDGRPVAKRSLSMIEKEIAEEERNMILHEGSEVETQQDVPPVVAALPVPPYLSIQSQGKDPSVENQNALVVYDDEQIRFTLEPEAPKVDELPEPETRAVVPFNPPKEPEGDVAKTPRKKSSRYSRYQKDEIYVCSRDELPENVRNSLTTRYEEPQDRQRSSRRKRRSTVDRLKDSLPFRKMSSSFREDDDYDDYDDVQLPGTESDSESSERRKKDKRKKKKSKDRSSSHKRHEHVESDPASEEHHLSKSPITSPFRRFSSSGLFSSIRRSSDFEGYSDS